MTAIPPEKELSLFYLYFLYIYNMYIYTYNIVSEEIKTIFKNSALLFFDLRIYIVACIIGIIPKR